MRRETARILACGPGDPTTNRCGEKAVTSQVLHALFVRSTPRHSMSVRRVAPAAAQCNGFSRDIDLAEASRTPAKKTIPLQALGRCRRHGYSARPLTTLVKGLFWKAMHTTEFQGSTDYSTLLDSEAWGTGGGLDAKTSDAITCQQLVLEHHAGRGGPLTADRAMRAAVRSITDDIFRLSGQTTCPACDSPLDEHTTGEVFMNALQVGHGLRFHTDEPPPPSTGSTCETTIIVLLRPASEGGLLRVSRLADGTATRPDVSGGHPYRDTDVLPLEAPGDTTWLDGRNAAHKVTKIKAGTRVSLCIGVMCPPWHTHEAPAAPTSQGEEGTDATQPTGVPV